MLNINTKEIQVFLASPGDVSKEREAITRLLGEWNTLYSKDKGISLNVLRWEKDLATRSGVKAQAEITEQLLKNSDILIGIFWSRFGSPTDKYMSGTLEEISYFLDRKKPVIMYFIDRLVSPSHIKGKDIDSIETFKNEYGKIGIYKSITKKASSPEFRLMLFKDIIFNIDNLLSYNKSAIGENAVVGTSEHKKPEWFEISIKKTIEDRLLKQSLVRIYNRDVTFDENCLLWNATDDMDDADGKAVYINARTNAFNIKYGNYNYANDLREKYKNLWFVPVTHLLNDAGFDKDKSLKVIGVGANNGTELEQIFSEYKSCSLNVLDLSSDATNLGEKLHGDRMKFRTGNMEGCRYLRNSAYDIYLNLRSIHSTGVDVRLALAECYRILKPGGIAIISISNGYLLPSTAQSLQKEAKEASGMYDNRTKFFSDQRPYFLADKVRKKLELYGFKEVELHTGKTEIFIKGIR